MNDLDINIFIKSIDTTTGYFQNKFVNVICVLIFYFNQVKFKISIYLIKLITKITKK